MSVQRLAIVEPLATIMLCFNSVNLYLIPQLSPTGGSAASHVLNCKEIPVLKESVPSSPIKSFTMLTLFFLCLIVVHITASSDFSKTMNYAYDAPEGCNTSE